MPKKRGIPTIKEAARASNSARQLTRPTKTYIIHHAMTNTFKIGRSVNPESRLKQLQVATPGLLEIALVIDHDVEWDMHRIFDYHSIGGEWFRSCPSILSLIAFLSHPDRQKDGFDYWHWKRKGMPKRKPASCHASIHAFD